MSKSKKSFSMPHIYFLLFIVILVCTIATWIIPSGEFDRVLNDAGQSVVVAGSYHAVDAHHVGLFEMMQSIFLGLYNSAPIVLGVFLTYAGFEIIINSGAISGVVHKVLGVLKGRSRVIIIPVFLVIFGVASSTVGMFEEAFPFIPLFVIIAINMGYDAIVGLAIVALGIGMGYSGATINTITVILAQTIAGVPLLSGIGYRIFCHLVMIVIASIYTIRYALKITADPTKSLVYGDDFSHMMEGNTGEPKLGIREKLVLLVLVGGIALLAYGVITYHWYFQEICGLVVSMGIISGIIMGMGPNQIAEKFASSFSNVASACMMIGIARAILVVLQSGCIMDTIVYYASLPFIYVPVWLSGVAMLVFQTFLNFLIPSGSGQAVTSMPIMTPMADILNVSRDVAVLAFQFGDGLSNILWPTAFAPVICGLAGVKPQKWWKWFVPLFLLLFLAQCILIIIAVMTGFGT